MGPRRLILTLNWDWDGGACWMSILSNGTTEHKSGQSGQTCRQLNVTQKMWSISWSEKVPLFHLYIGESSRCAKDRFYNHWGNIHMKKLDILTGLHFNLPDRVMISQTWVGYPSKEWVRESKFEQSLDLLSNQLSSTSTESLNPSRFGRDIEQNNFRHFTNGPRQ